jgi:hypothetical protein
MRPEVVTIAGVLQGANSGGTGQFEIKTDERLELDRRLGSRLRPGATIGGQLTPAARRQIRRDNLWDAHVEADVRVVRRRQSGSRAGSSWQPAHVPDIVLTNRPCLSARPPSALLQSPSGCCRGTDGDFSAMTIGDLESGVNNDDGGFAGLRDATRLVDPLKCQSSTSESLNRRLDPSIRDGQPCSRHRRTVRALTWKCLAICASVSHGSQCWRGPEDLPTTNLSRCRGPNPQAQIRTYSSVRALLALASMS